MSEGVPMSRVRYRKVRRLGAISRAENTNQSCEHTGVKFDDDEWSIMMAIAFMIIAEGVDCVGRRSMKIQAVRKKASTL